MVTLAWSMSAGPVPGHGGRCYSPPLDFQESPRRMGVPRPVSRSGRASPRIARRTLRPFWQMPQEGGYDRTGGAIVIMERGLNNCSCSGKTIKLAIRKELRLYAESGLKLVVDSHQQLRKIQIWMSHCGGQRSLLMVKMISNSDFLEIIYLVLASSKVV
ncbi:unnamed protein product [Clavelina lepadiformis]|uniref:Uncharacterized protein n=1 Tax=Clavelina lepadiformis TaxID=159417 RepID=A0ABP0FZM6_CLALP